MLSNCSRINIIQLGNHFICIDLFIDQFFFLIQTKALVTDSNNGLIDLFDDTLGTQVSQRLTTTDTNITTYLSLNIFNEFESFVRNTSIGK